MKVSFQEATCKTPKMKDIVIPLGTASISIWWESREERIGRSEAGLAIVARIG